MRKIVTIPLICLTFAIFSYAGVLHVPGEYMNIQAGILAAGTGDTVMIADGTYSGTGNVGLDFEGTDIVLMSENGPLNCIIDLAWGINAFYFHNGETSASVIDGIYIKNGYSEMGGGICIENSSPTIKNCSVADCQASGSGGGFYIIGGAPTLENCTIHNNFASMGGGLSVNNSEAVINSCIIAANASAG